MNRFEIRIGKRLIAWDSCYGMDNRRGWSIAIDGSYVVQLGSLWSVLGALFRKEGA